METIFNFNSQICTTMEQSKRLIALGLKKETADMVYQCFNPFGRWYVYLLGDDEIEMNKEIPAWSLHRLLEMLADCSQEYYMVFIPRAYDDIISSIESQIEKGYFNNKYLA